MERPDSPRDLQLLLVEDDKLVREQVLSLSPAQSFDAGRSAREARAAMATSGSNASSVELIPLSVFPSRSWLASQLMPAA